MEAASHNADALLQKLFGADQKVMQGCKERLDLREVTGDRLGRELVLEPRK